MKSRGMRFVIGCIGFWMVLSAMLMLSTPFMTSSVVTDYGHPSVARWIDAEKKKAEVEFKRDMENDVLVFQREKLGLPLSLTFNQLASWGLGLGFLFLTIMGFSFDIEDDNEDQAITFLISVAALIITIAATIVAAAKGSHYDNVVRSTIKDGNLADAVISSCDSDLVANVIGPILLIIIVGIILSLAHYLLRYKVFAALKDYVSDLVKAALNRYRDRLFAEVFREGKDAIFAAFVQENGGYSQENPNPDTELIQILPNGTVEVVKYRYDIEYRPFPVLVPCRQVMASISMDNFFRHLVSETKEEAFRELSVKFYERYAQSFNEAGKKAVNACAATLVKRAEDTFDKMLEELRKSHLDSSRKNSERLIQRVTTQTLRKFKDEVSKIGKDEISAMLTGLKGNLIEEVQNKVDYLSDITEASPQIKGDRIMPTNTRFYLDVEGFQIVVVEQPPIVRSVVADDELVGDGKERFSLAFPFVVFIAVFYKDQLHNLWAYYRNKPLQSLDDVLCVPNLTNIYENCSVCLRFPGHRQSDFAGKVDEVITHFWNSEFNTDLRQNYDAYSHSEEELRNFPTWEKKSQKNPLFPLSIKWRELATLRNLIMYRLRDVGNSGVSSEEIKSEIEAAFESGGVSMQEALKRRFSKIEVKERYSENIAAIVKEHEDKVIGDSVSAIASSFKKACAANYSSIVLAGAIQHAAEEAIGGEFEQLAKDVLFRRRMDAPNLIERIKEENRRS